MDYRMRKMKDPQQKLEKLKQLQPQFLVTNVEPEELQKETFKKRYQLRSNVLLHLTRKIQDTGWQTQGNRIVYDKTKDDCYGSGSCIGSVLCSFESQISRQVFHRLQPIGNQ